MSTSEDSRLLIEEALGEIRRLRGQLRTLKADHIAPIAIIGLGCRFPGAPDPQSLWRMLDDGVDAITEVPEGRWDLDRFGQLPGTRRGGFLDDVEGFDPAFFGIPPREATALDPQQRLLLEVAWEALEHAGRPPDRLAAARVGVFVGTTCTDYQEHALQRPLDELDVYAMTGTWPCFSAGRLSYCLGLQGPSYVVDTACSSSLVAVHLACESLRRRECDLALAGGVNLMLSGQTMHLGGLTRALSPTGRCRAFDADADGFVRAEGCGIVVLARLDDALEHHDSTWALIRGSAVNQDGASTGLTAPNPVAQQHLLRDALRSARLVPDDIDYLEAHGTGTPLGDPIELQSIEAVYGAAHRPGGPLAVGSVKTNLGHLESAAGVAGLIKVVLSMHHERIPATLHFRRLNPHIDLGGRSIEVTADARAWPRGPRVRRAGVSSFGMSGTNAHLLLEEATVRPRSEAEAGRQLLPLSGKSAAAIRTLAARVADRLAEDPPPLMSDVGFTLRAGRSHHAYRAAITVGSRSDAIAALQAVARDPGSVRRIPDTSPPVAFLFTGQGSQYPGMGRDLYRDEPVFRSVIDRCTEILADQIPVPLTEALFEDGDHLQRTELVQPALVALELALARLWSSWGVEPDLVCGHSVGEYAAACVAGVFDLETCLRLIAHRGRVMERAPGPGGMLSVQAESSVVRDIIETMPGLAIAAVNGPGQHVIAGPLAQIESLRRRLEEQRVRSRLVSSTYAFHSPSMDTILDVLGRGFEAERLDPPHLPFMSTSLGRRVRDELVTADYWCRQARAPVLFDQSLVALVSEGAGIFVELGPQPVLTSLGSRRTPPLPGVWLPSLRRRAAPERTMTDSLRRLYLEGLTPSWETFERSPDPRRIALPPHPFERRRLWCARPVTSEPSPSPARASINLGEAVPSPGREAHWLLDLDLDRHDYLRDHRVRGRLVVPGAVYLAMLLASTEAGRLEDVRFVEPLTLPADGAAALHLVLAPEGEGLVGQIASTNGSGGWRCHARARWSATPTRFDALELDLVRSRCTTTRDAAEFYDRVAASGAVLGPSFQWIAQLQVGRGEALARLRAPESLASLAPAHPTLLDAAMQLLMASTPDGPTETTFVPTGLEALELRGPLPSVLYAHGVVEQSSPRSHLGRVVLADEVGRVVGRIEGLRIESLRSTDRSSGHHYRTTWIPRVPPAPPSRTRGCVLLGDRGEIASALARRLEARKLPAVVVPHEAWCGEDPDHSIAAALERLGTKVSPVVLALEVLDHPGDSPGAARDACAQVARSLRWLARLDPSWAAPLWWVTHGAFTVDDVTTPPGLAASATAGLLAVANRELPSLVTGVLDLPTLDPEIAADALCRWLHDGTGDEPRLAIRSEQVYAERIVPAPMPSPSDDTFTPTPGRAYLITGAFGALGRHLATWLVDHGVGQLLLVGRRPPSAEVQRGHDHLRSCGASIRAHQLDVSDKIAVSEFLEGLRAEGVSLEGIFHLAGSLIDRTVLRMDDDDLTRTFASKAAGAWNLHHATASMPIEHFVLFSSAAPVFGSPGQAAYAAANAYLDGLARYRRERYLPACSIRWGAWRGGGMATRTARLDLERWALEPHEATKALQQAMSTSVVDPLIGRFDRTSLERHGLSPAPNRTSAPRSVPPSLAERLHTMPAHLRAAAVESVVSTTVNELLGGLDQPIPLDRSVFELGFDSLMALELRESLEAATGLSLFASLAFEHPSVSDLTGLLLDRLGLSEQPPTSPPEPPPEPSAPPLPSAIDSLTDDEALQLLLGD